MSFPISLKYLNFSRIFLGKIGGFEKGQEMCNTAKTRPKAPQRMKSGFTETVKFASRNRKEINQTYFTAKIKNEYKIELE